MEAFEFTFQTSKLIIKKLLVGKAAIKLLYFLQDHRKSYHHVLTINQSEHTKTKNSIFFLEIQDEVVMIQMINQLERGIAFTEHVE